MEYKKIFAENLHTQIIFTRVQRMLSFQSGQYYHDWRGRGAKSDLLINLIQRKDHTDTICLYEKTNLPIDLIKLIGSYKKDKIDFDTLWKYMGRYYINREIIAEVIKVINDTFTNFPDEKVIAKCFDNSTFDYDIFSGLDPWFVDEIVCILLRPEVCWKYTDENIIISK